MALNTEFVRDLIQAINTGGPVTEMLMGEGMKGVLEHLLKEIDRLESDLQAMAGTVETLRQDLRRERKKNRYANVPVLIGNQTDEMLKGIWERQMDAAGAAFEREYRKSTSK